MKTWKIVCLWLLVPPVLLAAVAAWVIWGGISNPRDRNTVGDIATPVGYERVAVDSGSFGAFLRDFPLQRRGARIRYYDGSLAYGQYLGYAVLDLPIFGKDEQCADSAMRLRAEYLWLQGKYGDIHFPSVEGKNLQDKRGSAGGARQDDHQSLERYLRSVYGKASTASLSRALPRKKACDITPGDILVYDASRTGLYGHAVTVADVAVNPKTGDIAVLLVEGSMPAQSIHIARNLVNPLYSPWIKLNPENVEILSSGFLHFNQTDLRSW